jgi:hypothetical protein
MSDGKRRSGIDRAYAGAVALTRMRRRLVHDLIGVRTRRGVTVGQLAYRAGTSASAIRRFEAGFECDDLDLDMVLRYAHAVGAAREIGAGMMDV